MIMERERSLVVCLLAAVVLAATVDGQSDTEFDTKLKEALNQAHVSSTQNLSSWDVKPVGSEFNCFPFVHLQEARNVHELTPYDIKIVAALGDSVTAAFGAKACTIIDDIIEFRGVSWSVGGDGTLSSVTTIPNIIKKYNPEVVGFSVKTGRPGSHNAHLNRAISGAIAQDMLGEAETLVEMMKEMKNIDFENDWKLVTLWIGGNNLCAYCKDKEKHSVANYIKGISDALDYLHANLPRTFVNLVQIIDITKLRNTRPGVICDLVHAAVCSCLSDEETAVMATTYQNGIAELVDSGRYNKTDDFTVVVQPFMIGVEVPMMPDNKHMDMSYLAPDCFHFSTKGHREGAVALWNNMIEPVGSKTQGWTPNGPIHCPKEPYYFYTSKNSKSDPGFSNEDVDPHHGSNHVQQGQGLMLGSIIAGSVVGIVVIAGIVAVLVILAVLVVRRKNRSKTSGESIPLVN